MKKIFKPLLAFTAMAVLAGATVVPALVSAWGDNSGGRPSYTIKQINSGVLGDKVVFNSISDSTIGDEKNFVAARENTGINAGAKNTWHGNDITVQEGKTYLIRLYVHNNNPKGNQAVAKNVRTTFSVPSKTGKKVEVNGFINSSNATPSEYWDYVNFNSDRNFHLEYVKGSALLENNGIGKKGGKVLSDAIITAGGVQIGYNALNGEVPGCYQYASYVTIKVKPVFDSNYNMEKKVRLVGEKTWQESVHAKLGEKVEYQIKYQNTGSATARNVMVKDQLPANLKLVSGTTKLYNANYPKGTKIDQDDITTKGINIGGYTAGSNAYVRFTAEAVDANLVCGDNTVTNWAQVGIGDSGSSQQDSANVVITKVCQTTPVTPQSTTPTAMPTTGPAAVASAVVGAGALVTSTFYYLASRRQLR